jgi:pimeloyl-ACP methyl ester carboxylesterase
MTRSAGRTTAASASESQPLPTPSEDRTIEAAGLKLHYLDYGTEGRRPMLCLHGGAVNAHWFDFVAGDFTSEYHVRALDHRGHGDSQRAEPPDYRYTRYAEDVAEVVEKLDLRDFVLVGHSMGGTVSLVYAATHPGRVKRVVIIDSTLRATPERVASLRAIGMAPGSSYETNDEFRANFRLRPEGTTAVPGIIRHLAQYGGRQDEQGRWRHKFDRNVYATRELFHSMPYWDRIGIPALLVKGALSDRITPDILDEVKRRCPQVEIEEVSGSDHHVTLDNPPGFVAAVKAFLGRHPWSDASTA